MAKKAEKTAELPELPELPKPIVVHTVPPKLKFSPYAWAKLRYMNTLGNTEISGFGITLPENPLFVVDFLTILQTAGAASFEWEDEDVLKFFAQQARLGKHPVNFARIWIHTHPGESNTPSGLDEDRFEACFGTCSWAVMVILTQSGKVYARLNGMQLSETSSLELMLNSEVDYQCEFPGCNYEEWKEEYTRNIQKKVYTNTYTYSNTTGNFNNNQKGHFVVGHWEASVDYSGVRKWVIGKWLAKDEVVRPSYSTLLVDQHRLPIDSVFCIGCDSGLTKYYKGTVAVCPNCGLVNVRNWLRASQSLVITNN